MCSGSLPPPVMALPHFPPLQPDYTSSRLERTQHLGVAPRENIYSSGGPPTSAYGNFPDLTHGNLVDPHERMGLSAHHLLHINLQLQETIQSRLLVFIKVSVSSAVRLIMYELVAKINVCWYLSDYIDQPSQYTINSHPLCPLNQY